jgi:tetratricopeptide (TPR) repeat protein
MHARARIAVRAEEMWRKSMRINQELARTHPANVSYRAALADGNKNVGTLALFEQNQPETAAVALRDASAVYERLEHDFPETLYYGNNLLVSWQTLAFVYEHLNQFSHALDLADHVLGHLETRFPENQRDDRFRTLYLEWLGLRARVLRRLDRLDEALDVCDRALKVVNDEKRHDWERFREIVTAFSLLQEGEPQRAVQLAGQVLGRSSPDGSTLALAAALNARAAVRIASSKTPGSDAASLAETYASNAILCLKEAHKKGAFPFEFQRTGLVTDPDLAGLQGQPEFVKLLSEIIGPSAAPQ